MNRTAIPTEYCGVKFRSKSEAIFARAIDVAWAKSDVMLAWTYEPSWLGEPYHVNQYHPDFHINLFLHKEIDSPTAALFDASFLVELKPSKITDTYKARVEEWFFDTKVSIPMIFCCKNVYELQKTPYVYFLIPNGFSRELEQWSRMTILLAIQPIFAALPKAKAYRFDLSESRGGVGIAGTAA